jgi:hypothetical protein
MTKKKSVLEKAMEGDKTVSKEKRIMDKITKETGLTPKEIQDRVEEKKSELKGLITEEGALFIIANDLCVDIPNNPYKSKKRIIQPEIVEEPQEVRT